MPGVCSASSQLTGAARGVLYRPHNKYINLFSLLPAISLLIKIQASYLKHKLSIYAPRGHKKIEVIGIFFKVKKYFFCSNVSIFSGTPGAKIESLCLNMKPVSLLGEKWLAKD